MIYFCSNKNRRALVLQRHGLNGIDYIEVARTGTDCGKQLLVTLLKPDPTLLLGPSQVQVTGGASSSAQVKVVSVSLPTSTAPRVLTVELDKSGDFSTYTFSLISGPGSPDPPLGMDPQLSSVSFSFKAGCPTVADCAPNACCPPDTNPVPDINYLAKDFGGFRQVMLDRMAVLAPAWNETHASDIGIALVEMLAYAADHLSYQQDAAGTEAYIARARSRISLRRHARLVDYRINEGSNARTWLYVKLAKGTTSAFIPGGTVVYPYTAGYLTAIEIGSSQAAALAANSLGFTTMQDAELSAEQNCLQFYTWQDSNCCLSPGATQATLVGHLTTLSPGTVLIFEEVLGPNTGDPDDANPNNRWAVRLTGVRNTDHLGNVLVDPLTTSPQAITQITWAPEDALPLPLCLSSTTDLDHGSRELTNVSVARGNIIPADHGVWQDQPVLGSVNLTNGQPTVTGNETAFLSTLQVGQWLVFKTDATQTPYEISNIENEATLTLSENYRGATTQYAIAAVIEDMGEVPPPPPSPVTESSCTCNAQNSSAPARPRYYPQLAHSSVTYAWPFDPFAPASQFMLPPVPSALGFVSNETQPIVGIVTLTKGSPIVIGNGTSFTSSVEAGEMLVFGLDGAQVPYQIESVTDDATLTLTSNYAGCLAGSTSAAILTAVIAPNQSIVTRAQPQIRVQDSSGRTWTVLDDLLSSEDSQSVCLLEVEYDGTAFVRFGDGQYGMPVEEGMDFQTHYRVGNGRVGNVGGGSLTHIVTSAENVGAIELVRNPLAAAGGVDPEAMEHIEQVAPYAFRTQLRAVTEDDYGTMAEKDPAVEEARGTLRWTGSWYAAFVSLDTVSESGPDDFLLAETKKSLDMLRMMGVDLQVEGAVIVGLDIELTICVAPGYFQADVENALMQLFVSGNQCTGQPGILNHKNFTFGQTIYTSPFIAAAQGVEGVASVTIKTFQRMDDPLIDGAALGYITLGRLEIARCDNDPNRLDFGKFVLWVDGGK